MTKHICYQIRDVLVLLVNGAHECCRWGKHLLYKDEDGLLRRQLDSLPDNINELTNSQILRVKRIEKSPLDHNTQQTRTDGTKYFFLSIVGMSV